MTTTILDAAAPIDSAVVRRAVEVLSAGGLVAFPTETVYGLGADALNPLAVLGVFKAKGRPAENPLIVHIASIDQLVEVGRDISPTALRLAGHFWPGPMTLVVKNRNVIPPIVTAGLDTVAVRIPDHAVPRALIEGLGHGIVGPSANTSGRPSPTTARHVHDDLNGRIDLILDAGPTTIGVESTVIDTTSDPPCILRFGGLTREAIESVAGPVGSSTDPDELKRSPGTRHRHYAPKARVVIVEENDLNEMQRRAGEYLRTGSRVGCIVHSQNLIGVLPGVTTLHAPSRMEEYAKLLYASLRKADELGVDVILVEAVSEAGLGKAVMDRLRRAAE